MKFIISSHLPHQQWILIPQKCNEIDSSWNSTILNASRLKNQAHMEHFLPVLPSVLS